MHFSLHLQLAIAAGVAILGTAAFCKVIIVMMIAVMLIVIAKMKVEWSVKRIKLTEEDNCCGVIDEQEQQLDDQ